MYTCSEVVRLISSDEYLAAGRLKRLGIKMHLVLCKYCARYLKQLRTLARAARDSNPTVPTSDLEHAKTRILRDLSKQP